MDPWLWIAALALVELALAGFAMAACVVFDWVANKLGLGFDDDDGDGDGSI